MGWRALFFLVFVSCGNGPVWWPGQRDFVVAQGDATEVALVGDVIALVDEELGCKWLRYEKGGTRILFNEPQSYFAAAGTGVIGDYDPVANTCAIDAVSDDTERTDILVHEMGHAVGLAHETDTIMNSYILIMPLDDAVASLVKLVHEHHLCECCKR